MSLKQHRDARDSASGPGTDAKSDSAGYSQTDASLSEPGDWDESPPTAVGHYEIEAEIGRGGMGVVYRARDLWLDREVAVKALPLALASAPRRARFEREAKLIALVNHPSIASIHAVEEVDGRLYLILEYVPGESLAERLARGPLAVAEVIALGSQLAQAMEAAHERGVIHRDLKPANLRVMPDGRVKVLDFGLAKELGVDDPADAGEVAKRRHPDLTGAGALLGTISYMSPEQVEGATADRRSDVWAFGCILFESLAGGRIWGDGSAEDRISALRTSEPSWERLPPQTPEAVRGLLADCLAKEPHLRPRFGEVHRSLSTATKPSGDNSELRRGNLPRQFTRFVGRRTQISEVGQLFTASHLVTIVGPGGFGKTRLAYAIADHHRDRFPDGTWVVDLAPLGSAGAVNQALAAVFGVKESADRDPIDAVADQLTDSVLLLVLDNCERLHEAAAALAHRLLDRCPGVAILATSRRPLSVVSESRYPVQPLALPNKRTAVDDNDAVQLFVERAGSAVPGFVLTATNTPAVIEICRQLDGIPLAIEIAASRLRALTVDQLASRLTDRIASLRPSSGGKRETLREAIEWSYQSLDGQEQTLLRRLSVFCRSFNLDATEAVCPGGNLDEGDVLDALTELIDNALVAVEKSGDEVRYRLLETVREFLLERLAEADEERAVAARHLRFYRDLAESSEAPMMTADGELWVERLEEERDNLRAALHTAIEQPDLNEDGLRLAAACEQFWIKRRGPREELAQLRRLIDVAASPRTEAFQNALCCAGYLAQTVDELTQSAEDYGQALALADELGSKPGRARALHGMAIVAVRRADLREAGAYLQEELAIRNELDDHRSEHTILGMLSNVALRAGDLAAARNHAEAAIARTRATGDRPQLALELSNLAVIALESGNSDEAQRYLEESLALRIAIRDDRGALRTRVNLATVAFRRHDTELAKQMCEAALDAARALEEREVIATCLNNLVAIGLATGELDHARQHVVEGLRLSRAMDDRILTINLLENLARIEAGSGRQSEAALILGATAAERERRGLPRAPDDADEYETDLDQLRTKLGRDELDRLLAEGAERTSADFG